MSWRQGGDTGGGSLKSQVNVEMRALSRQLVLLTTLFSSCRTYFLHELDGYPELRYDFHDGPPPLGPPQHPPFHHPPLFHDSPPLIYRAPPQTVVVHVPVRGIFPPFIERIVQRIQTFWSVYNPPEVLTRPPPHHVPTTTKRPTKKVTLPTSSPTLETTPTLLTSDVTSPTATEDSTTKVSTLAVYEVTPTSTPEPPSSVEGTEADTEEPLFITPERASALGQKEAFLRFLKTGQGPPFLQPEPPSSVEGTEADTAELLFITPERASALGQKEAFLRFLKTGQVPPFLQPDSINEMDTEEDTFT